MVNVSVGSSVSASGNAVASKPKWMKWTGSTTLSGTVKLPSGHRRLIELNTSNARVTTDYYVVPLSIGLTDAPWRATIFAPNGSYITSSGTGDIPTIGTPTVRIGVNAPSKAVIKFPVLKNTSGNILASTFAGWNDGHAEAVSRGMEITVEYRDADSGSLRMAFRGMIYQIESGDVITITAYDRLMDLAQYSDQYQSHAGYTQNDTSRSRAISGDDYIYTMNNAVGSLLTANTTNVLKIDATSSLTYNNSHTAPAWYLHPLPRINGVGLEQGHEITRIHITTYSYFTARRYASSAPYSGQFLFRAKPYLYRKINGVLTQVATVASGLFWTGTVGSSDLNDHTAAGAGDLEWVKGDVNWGSSNWTIEGDPSEYYVGIFVEYWGVSTSGWEMRGHTEFAKYTPSKLTFTGDFYTSNNGSSWSVGSGDHPEIGITFTHSGSSVNVGSITASGNTLTVSRFNIPDGPSDGYLSTVDKGIRLIVSYFITSAAGIKGIVEDLLQWAGLTADVINDNMGTTTYYTSSTYDYLSCILELLRNGNYAIKASIEEPGKAIVRSRHTVSEASSITFTTDPSASGEQVILSHDLTAHWMAEKATQAYIAENATSSGLPVALETDDALMDNSLTVIMESPLRSVIVDNTLGTHNLQAYAAGGKKAQLHTNVFEGKMTLAGYRLDVWDFTSGNVGGMPIGINVPEYGAQGTAIPTEIILGEGVTQVSLDNIRTADRSEIANAMGLSADAISNNASAVPNSVYVFARMNRYSKYATPGSVTNVKIYTEDGVAATQSNSGYIKIVEDTAGYAHIVAVFPTADQPGGYATNKPIQRVSATWSGTEYMAVFDNPKYAYGGQNVQVDLRFERA